MPNKMERFTQRARRVLSLAQEEAEKLKHRSIGTGHFLLGLIREDAGVAGHVLRGLDVGYEKAMPIVRELSTGEVRQPGTPLDLSPDTKRLLEQAVAEARQLGHDYIGTEHLLLAVLLQRDSMAVQVLQRLNVDLDTVQKHVIKTIRQEERSVLRPGMKPVSSMIRRRFANVMPTPMMPPSPNPETMKILQMIEDKVITPEQGENLLKVLTTSGFITPPRNTAINLDQFVAEDDKRQLRIVISSKATGETLFFASLPVQGVPNQLGNVLSTISNGLIGNFLTMDSDEYQIDLFIDKPADEEAS
jgi:hypothetical protein